MFSQRTKILKYIKSGDVFQVNLSREWHGKIKKSYTASDIFSKSASLSFNLARLATLETILLSIDIKLYPLKYFNVT